MKTICSADFPDSLGLCRNSLSFVWSCVPLLSEHVPHGGAQMSCLMPLLGPGLPEDRNPGPTTPRLSEAWRYSLLTCMVTEGCGSPVRLAGPSGSHVRHCPCCGGAAFMPRKPPTPRSCCRDRLWEARASGVVAPGSTGAIVVCTDLAAPRHVGSFWIEPVSLALAGRFFNPESAGMPEITHFSLLPVLLRPKDC